MGGVQHNLFAGGSGGGEVIYDLDGAQGQGLLLIRQRASQLGGEYRLANGEIMPGRRDLWRGNLENRIQSRELMGR